MPENYQNKSPQCNQNQKQTARTHLNAEACRVSILMGNNLANN